jgi:hypothetical protein
LLGFRSVVKDPCFISSHNGVQKLISFLCVHLLRWEIVWRNAPRILQDFGSALSFQTRLTQTKPVLPLSNEYSSQVKDQGRRQCCHNKHKTFPTGLHVMYLYFPDMPRRFCWYSVRTGRLWIRRWIVTCCHQSIYIFRAGIDYFIQ